VLDVSMLLRTMVLTHMYAVSMRNICYAHVIHSNVCHYSSDNDILLMSACTTFMLVQLLQLFDCKTITLLLFDGALYRTYWMPSAQRPKQ
jgi:hypothetical protein